MTTQLASGTMPSKLLILDVDGVVSPVHPVPGTLPWRDEIEVGDVFGPVLVSPTLCARLDRLAQHPDLSCVWLTSWTPGMRARMKCFPGRTWPDIGQPQRNPTGGPERDHETEWWKWRALRSWLDTHTGISRIVWCDDDIGSTAQRQPPQPDPEGARRSAASDEPLESLAERTAVWGYLDNRRITSWLIAPRVDIGLTPRHLDSMEAFLALPDPR
jgi:hypothetical protein